MQQLLAQTYRPETQVDPAVLCSLRNTAPQQHDLLTMLINEIVEDHIRPILRARTVHQLHQELPRHMRPFMSKLIAAADKMPNVHIDDCAHETLSIANEFLLRATRVYERVAKSPHIQLYHSVASAYAGNVAVASLMHVLVSYIPQSDVNCEVADELERMALEYAKEAYLTVRRLEWDAARPTDAELDVATKRYAAWLEDGNQLPI